MMTTKIAKRNLYILPFLISVYKNYDEFLYLRITVRVLRMLYDFSILTEPSMFSNSKVCISVDSIHYRKWNQTLCRCLNCYTYVYFSVIFVTLKAYVYVGGRREYRSQTYNLECSRSLHYFAIKKKLRTVLTCIPS